MKKSTTCRELGELGGLFLTLKQIKVFLVKGIQMGPADKVFVTVWLSGGLASWL